MIKKLTALLLFPLILWQTIAANHYIRSGATGGTKTGADWNNAYTNFNFTPIRGDNYYVAGGTNYSPAWDNLSGTTVGYTIHATVANHGTSTGWSDIYTNASFFDKIQTSVSHWVWDGVTGGGGAYSNMTNGALYGFRILNTADTILFMLSDKAGGPSSRPNVTNITIAHFEMASTIIPGNCEGINLTADSAVFFNLNVFSNYLHDIGDGPMTLQHLDGGFIKANYIGRNGSSTDHHGVLVRHDYSSNIGYYNNWFEDGVGTGFVGGYDATGTNFTFAGNIFVCTPTIDPLAESSTIGNGVIYTLNNGSVNINAHNWSVFNNTFYNTQLAAAIGIFETDGSCVVTNNIFYKRYQNGTSTDWAMTGITSHGYNYFGSPTGHLTEATSGTFGSDPFQASSTYDFRLTTQVIGANIPTTIGGIAVSSEYSTDMLGVTRTNGAVTIGALQGGVASGGGGGGGGSTVTTTITTGKFTRGTIR